MVVLLPDRDLDENVAAARVAAALAGPHVEVSAPHQGMVMLRSARRGFFRIDATSLAMVNAQAGVLALTAADERAVDVGAALAAVKIAPLLLPEQVVECIEAACTESARVINVMEIPARQVALVGTTRLRSRARPRAEDTLSETQGL
jgi:hypothetical protein